MEAIETDRTTVGVELKRVRVPLSSMLINRQPARGGGRVVAVLGGDHRHQQSRYTSQRASGAVIPSLS